MRACPPKQDHSTVGRNHRCRVPQNSLDIVFTDSKVDPAAVAALNQPQCRIRRILDRAGLAPPRGDIIESLARKRRVPVAPGDHDVASITPAASFEEDPDCFHQNPAARHRIAQAFENVIAAAFLRPDGHERGRMLVADAVYG